MTFKTLETISRLLNEQLGIATEEKDRMTEMLRRKYNTDWIGRAPLTEEENTEYGRLIQKVYDLNAALDDFNEYQW